VTQISQALALTGIEDLVWAPGYDYAPSEPSNFVTKLPTRRTSFCWGAGFGNYIFIRQRRSQLVDGEWLIDMRLSSLFQVPLGIGAGRTHAPRPF